MAWQKVASLDALRAGEAFGVDVDGATIALFRIGDEIFAADGICTHAYATLADGFVEGDTIECPLHQALFDIRTGKVLAGPATESLKVYPVKVAGGDVLVELGGTQPAREAPAATAAAPRDGGLKSDSPRAGNGQPESHDTTANGGTITTRQYVWPGNDLTIIPDWVYTDQYIYEREVE
jgi:anthranilate 1,2-dioxygenase large subunit